MTDLSKNDAAHQVKSSNRQKLLVNKWAARLACLCLFWGILPAQAFTLSEIEADAHLTPASLLRRFADFKFKLCDGVQPRDQFLASQSGDCDDFATLAADVLRKKGYHTRLIAVFMPLQTHVVCAVSEVKAYLDYNNRRLPSPLVPTDGRLRDVADKVARSFHTTWRCASEYTFDHGVRHTVRTDFR